MIKSYTPKSDLFTTSSLLSLAVLVALASFSSVVAMMAGAA